MSYRAAHRCPRRRSRRRASGFGRRRRLRRWAPAIRRVVGRVVSIAVAWRYRDHGHGARRRWRRYADRARRRACASALAPASSGPSRHRRSRWRRHDDAHLARRIARDRVAVAAPDGHRLGSRSRPRRSIATRCLHRTVARRRASGRRPCRSAPDWIEARLLGRVPDRSVLVVHHRPSPASTRARERASPLRGRTRRGDAGAPSPAPASSSGGVPNRLKITIWGPTCQREGIVIPRIWACYRHPRVQRLLLTSVTTR